MRRELFRIAADLAERGEPFAVATVVERRSPSSARAGDTCIVTASGAFHGFVGGSCTRPTVVQQALLALTEGTSRTIVLSPDPSDVRRSGASVFPMTCHSGGSVEIQIQPVLPPARLLVFGITPTARALVRLGAAMGYRVTAVDPAAERTTFPEAEAVLTDSGALGPITGEVLAVVATQGEWDEEAALAALAHSPTYLGVVASAKRAEELRGFLDHKVSGDARRALERLRAPAGLRMGARGGEEIALSILAEVVEQRHASRPWVRPVAAAAVQLAIDPVCGMSVATQGAPHHALHQGRSYFFCCAGCREKFAAAADSYVAASQGSA